MTQKESPPSPQENCGVRGLVHFSAHTYSNGLYVLAENMDLTPLCQDFAVLLAIPLPLVAASVV
jgi:hypothetical protein